MTRRNLSSETGAVAAKWTYAVLAFALLFVLMPFLFWRATWFGRPLNNEQLAAALTDTDNPHDIQHGLSQVADRIIRGDATAKQFYPRVIALASSPADPIRTMAAWVMGQDNTSKEFHQELLRLLRDPNPMVERNAALGLVRFGDPSGHDVIVAMLKPTPVYSPAAGILRGQIKEGDSVNPGTEIGEVEISGKKMEVTSVMSGRLGRWLVSDGSSVSRGELLAGIFPSDDMVWEALRGLYLIGEPADLDAISAYARGEGDAPPQIAEQARLTMEEIRKRASESRATSPAP